MLQPLSRVEEALRDTLAHKASGRALTRLGRLFGARRLENFIDGAWRRALRAVAYGARATPGTTGDFLEGAFSASNLEWSVTLDPAAPQNVTRVSGDVAAFTCEHVGKLARVKLLPASALPLETGLPARLWPRVSGLFLVEALVSPVGGASQVIKLCPVDTAQWRRADWSTGAFEVSTNALYQGATLEILPWFPIDSASAAKVTVYLDGSIVTGPPTYLLDPAGVDRTSIDANLPRGGIVMDEFNLDGDDPAPTPDGDQINGPHPIYLTGEAQQRVSRIFDGLLASGVKGEIVTRDWC